MPGRRMGSILIVSLLCFFAVFSLGVWKIENNIREGNFRFLEETASRIGRAIALRINASSHAMEAVGMGHVHDSDEEHFARVERIYNRLGLDSLIYVGTNGVGHDHAGKRYDFTDNSAVMAALGGVTSVFDCRLLLEDGEEGNHAGHLGLAVPVLQDDRVVGAVVA